MGLNKVAEICALYCQAGRGHVPMAVVQNGTRADEQSVIGQVWNIPQLVAEQGVGAPAVLIIGEVVALHPSYLAECLCSVSVAY